MRKWVKSWRSPLWSFRNEQKEVLPQYFTFTLCIVAVDIHLNKSFAISLQDTMKTVN